MPVSDIALILGTLGVRELLAFVVNWISGRAMREKGRVREVIDERDKAEDERDREAAYRRIIQEHASELRRLLIEAGAADIPPWPPSPTT